MTIGMGQLEKRIAKQIWMHKDLLGLKKFLPDTRTTGTLEFVIKIARIKASGTYESALNSLIDCYAAVDRLINSEADNDLAAQKRQNFLKETGLLGVSRSKGHRGRQQRAERRSEKVICCNDDDAARLDAMKAVLLSINKPEP